MCIEKRTSVVHVRNAKPALYFSTLQCCVVQTLRGVISLRVTTIAPITRRPSPITAPRATNFPIHRAKLRLNVQVTLFGNRNCPDARVSFSDNCGFLAHVNSARRPKPLALPLIPDPDGMIALKLMDEFLIFINLLKLLTLELQSAFIVYCSWDRVSLRENYILFSKTVSETASSTMFEILPNITESGIGNKT